MKKNERKSRGVECLLAIALLLVMPWALFAETGIGDKVFSIGPRATYTTAKDADEGQWNAGVQARLHITPSLGFEGSIDYLNNKFGYFTTIKTYPVQVSLLAYLFPGAAFSPFLLGGGGWYYTLIDGPFGFSHTDYRFGLHAGAGLEVSLNEGLSLDWSYRYVWLERVMSKDANALDKQYDDSGSMIAIALNFLF